MAHRSPRRLPSTAVSGSARHLRRSAFAFALAGIYALNLLDGIDSNAFYGVDARIQGDLHPDYWAQHVRHRCRVGSGRWCPVPLCTGTTTPPVPPIARSGVDYVLDMRGS
jgi:hypothetical protein